MAGTKNGGKASAETNKQRYGSDFYMKIGAMGGKKSRTGGFFADPELASTSGRKGGTRSRRGFKLLKAENGYLHYQNSTTKEVEILYEDNNTGGI